MALLRRMVLLLLLSVASANVTFPLPSKCPNSCGSIRIRYPFGIGEGCFRPSFDLTCDNSSTPPKLFISNTSIQVMAIRVDDQLVIINSTVVTMSLETQSMNISLIDQLQNKPYLLYPYNSNSQDYLSALASSVMNDNKVWVVGCDVIANLVDVDKNRLGGCVSICTSIEDAVQLSPDDKKSLFDSSCNGMGCCVIDIPSLNMSSNIAMHLTRLNTTDMPFKNSTAVKAFVSGLYGAHDNQSYTRNDIYGVDESGYISATLRWYISDQPSCEEAKKNNDTYACLSHNSYCMNIFRGLKLVHLNGYICECSTGYEGNPYVPNGCQDIDECKYNYGCNGICINTDGNYSCICPPGTHGDDPIHEFCIPNKRYPLLLGLLLGVGIGISLLLVAGAIMILIKRWKKFEEKKMREKYFHKNHGLLLQQLIPSIDDTATNTKVFSLEELEKATNNFDDTRIVGQGGHGTVYKGILSDQRVIAIKKSKITIEREINQFINEVVILSQINHRNVVKLFGCCLETEVPLLVYEFISNGTLFHHLHHSNNGPSLSWDDRLRIATEVAGALAYLHSAACISIFHRDVKSSNILLDEYFTAKVSDFGASRSIPTDKTRVTTIIQGTFGYLDPEYYQTGQLTEKSDVYSFGVILLELLTGKEPICSREEHENMNLAMLFIQAMRDNQIHQLIDEAIMTEDVIEEIDQVFELAKMCLRLKGNERPTMKAVEHKLQGLRHKKSYTKRWNGEDCPESEYLLGDVDNAFQEHYYCSVAEIGSLEMQSILDSQAR